jgi:hypothetical protein
MDVDASSTFMLYPYEAIIMTLLFPVGSYIAKTYPARMYSY